MLFCNPILVMMINNGVRMGWDGIIMVNNINMKKIFLPRNLKRENPYPARVDKSTVPITVKKETIPDNMIARDILLLVNNILEKLSSVNIDGHHLGGIMTRSVAGFNEARKTHANG